METTFIKLATELGKKLQQQGLTLAVAESCTGGGISHIMTEIAGSSQWFDRGFITYSDCAKIEMLGVCQQTLEQFGAVDAHTALEMVQGVLKNSHANCAIAVTGIAGPGGGSVEKPVGTVFIAWHNKNTEPVIRQYMFTGNRQQIRQQSIVQALKKASTLWQPTQD